jgi:hypothetical protein
VRTIAITTALALAMGISGPAHAHHSPARFDIGAVMTLTGTLARYDFKNPHVYLYLQTADETGAAVTWELEASSTPNLVRRGWSADSLAVGDEISVEVNPPRLRNLRIARLQSVTKADGSVLAVRGDASVLEPADDTATASSLAGSWLGRYGL